MVAALMQSTGPTCRGFQKHLGSTDELLLESLHEAFREIGDTFGLWCGASTPKGSVEGDFKDLPELK